MTQCIYHGSPHNLGLRPVSLHF